MNNKLNIEMANKKITQEYNGKFCHDPNYIRFISIFIVWIQLVKNAQNLVENL